MIKEYKLKCAGGYRIMVESYNSAMEVVNDCRKRSITDRSFDNMNDGRLGGKDEEWCGVKSYDDALEFLQNGYQPIVDKLKENLKFNLQGDGKRISFKNDVVGYAPIVPLAVLGVPNNMINSTMKKIKAKVVDVYYDITCSFGTSSDDIIKYGTHVLSAIIKLEQSGYRFNLYGIQSYSDNKDADLMCVKIKDACQPIDLKRCSFPLAHTGFFRVIGFDWYSKTPKGRYRSCYGRAMAHEDKINKKLSEAFKEMFGQNAVYISATNIQKLGDKAKEHLKEVLTNAKSY